MKKRFSALLLSLTLLCLAACAEPSSPDGHSSTGEPSHAVLENASSAASSVPEADTSSSGAPMESEPIIVREDAQGLVTVRVEDGIPSIRLNHERWVEIYGDELDEVYAIDGGMDTIDFSHDPELFVPIGGVETAGRIILAVKDVCIGPVPAFCTYTWKGAMPIVILLLEDGRVQWLWINPVHEEFVCEPAFPYLTDIVSLSAEESGEGIGGPTIFATDAGGLRYNLDYFHGFTWNTFEDDNVIWNADAGQFSARMVCLGDNRLEYTLHDNETMIAAYEGTYEFVLSEDQPYRAPAFIVDLALVQRYDHAPEIETPDGINGAFFFEGFGIQEIYMTLWPLDGAPLYLNPDGSEPAEYTFWGDFMAGG